MKELPFEGWYITDKRHVYGRFARVLCCVDGGYRMAGCVVVEEIGANGDWVVGLVLHNTDPEVGGSGCIKVPWNPADKILYLTRDCERVKLKLGRPINYEQYDRLDTARVETMVAQL